MVDIHISYIKSKEFKIITYEGKLTIKNHGLKVTMLTQINRLTKKDALRDARVLRSEMLSH